MTTMSYSNAMGIDVKLVAKIQKIDPQTAAMLAANPVTAETQKRTPWPRVQVQILTVHLPHGPVVLRYAEDGANVRRLANARDLEDECEIQKAELDKNTAEVYARLYFTVQNQGPLEQERDLPWLASATASDKKKVAEILTPLAIRATPRGYAVVAHALDGKELQRMEVEFDRSGRTIEASHRTVLTGLPVAYLR